MELAEQIKLARMVSTPILAVSSFDQAATINGVSGTFQKDPVPPIVRWDCVRGIMPVNDFGKAALKKLPQPEIQGVGIGQNPTECLQLAAQLPPKCILWFCNAHRFWDNEGVVQAISNLRDLYKSNLRTLILLAPVISLPAELTQDVFPLDESLPDREQTKALILREYEGLRSSKMPELKDPSPKDLEKAVSALSGLAAFPQEQATAESLVRPEAERIPWLWIRKESFINQTKGLSVDKGNETFNDIGGLEAVKQFGFDLFGGNQPPTVIVRIEELEKKIAGMGGGSNQSGGDSSGVSQDQGSVFLTAFEDNGWDGMLAVGPAGTAKSFYSKVLGHQFDVPCLCFDPGAAKSKYVGESETLVRNAMKVLKAIGGNNVFFVATVNGLTTVPPPLKRRFKSGVFFFDLPTAEERESIWRINLRKYGLPLDSERPADNDWSGAEIRNCCERAWKMNKPVMDVSKYVVPVAVSDPESIASLRNMAAGKFLSASTPGLYSHKGLTFQVAGKRYISSDKE